MSCEASGAPGATRAGGHLGLWQPPAGPRAWHPQDPRGQRFLVKSRPRLSMLASFSISCGVCRSNTTRCQRLKVVGTAPTARGGHLGCFRPRDACVLPLHILL